MSLNFLFGDLVRAASAPLDLMNPQTGDPNAGIIWIVVGALVVSAVLIAVFALRGSKNKNKKKRRKR